jgi:hypothetical protein
MGLEDGAKPASASRRFPGPDALALSRRLTLGRIFVA